MDRVIIRREVVAVAEGSIKNIVLPIALEVCWANCKRIPRRAVVVSMKNLMDMEDRMAEA